MPPAQSNSLYQSSGSRRPYTETFPTSRGAEALFDANGLERETANDTKKWWELELNYRPNPRQAFTYFLSTSFSLKVTLAWLCFSGILGLAGFHLLVPHLAGAVFIFFGLLAAVVVAVHTLLSREYQAKDTIRFSLGIALAPVICTLAYMFSPENPLAVLFLTTAGLGWLSDQVFLHYCNWHLADSRLSREAIVERKSWLSDRLKPWA